MMRLNSTPRYTTRVRRAAVDRPDWWALAVGFGAGFGAVTVIFFGIPVAVALLNRGL